MFWDVTLCRGYVSGVFEGPYCLHLRGSAVQDETFLFELPLGLPGPGDYFAAVFVTAGRLCNITGLIQ